MSVPAGNADVSGKYALFARLVEAPPLNETLILSLLEILNDDGNKKPELVIPLSPLQSEVTNITSLLQLVEVSVGVLGLTQVLVLVLNLIILDQNFQFVLFFLVRE
jgi:hypothetical protein